MQLKGKNFQRYYLKIINMIKKLLEKNKLRLAPMAGVTNSPFREICLKNYAGFVTTEEIDATSLVYNQSERTKEISNFYEREKPIAMQLLGCDPKIMSEASIILQDMGADIIDINMGCPVPKITKKGKGAALMKDILETSKLVKSMRLVTKLPLTAKIRSGWNDENENALEFSKMLEEEGIDSITVHPRTRNQRYQGLSKWEIIKNIVDGIKIPVTGNGDVKSFDDAEKMLQFTSCNSVMIGRAAIGNPWIFNFNYQKLSDKNKLDKIISDILFHIELMKDFFSERNIDLQIKKQLSYYSKGFKNSKELRLKIFRSEEKIDCILEFFLENLRETFEMIETNLEKTKA
ncbi:MAG: tRNA dihydrouridine synthase DusB [Dehalococcoidia bacterium]|nr:tRNA dihydrouridine synthase DusB [Dehalococcoidia bacterium]|tara:strand:+ start:1173 stop:2213 length:1041 start_codon:yes stop_codon:yes gene_type:complete